MSIVPGEDSRSHLPGSHDAESSDLEFDDRDEHENWEEETSSGSTEMNPKFHRVESKERTDPPVMMVETAFLASTASLIWLVNYYFPLGPVLRIFFSIPLALTYLRWGSRAGWMSAWVSGLLLSVLMGPTRSVLFFIPYGLLGVLLGMLWVRRASWLVSVGLGALLGCLGFFFRFWFLSILLGEDLWVYLIAQISELAEWVFVQLGLLAQPNIVLIQVLAVGAVVLNSIVYTFVVHLVALLLFDRLGNPISRPPNWVQVLLDYEGR